MGLEGSQNILKQNGSVTDQTDRLSDDFEYISKRYSYYSSPHWNKKM